MEIKSLAYVGIGSVTPLAWQHFATEILGMMPARAVPGEGWENLGETKPPTERSGVAPDGSVYLKMDERQWRIAVHPHSRKGALLYLGMELDGPLEFAAAIHELEKENIEVTVGSDCEARARAVTAIARLRDPAGTSIELFYGQTFDNNFHSPFPDHRFVAGSLGVGHLNLFVTRQAECFDFYTRVLGFRLTDYFRYGAEARLEFLRCNRRHHSLAMIDIGGISGIQHMLVELADIDAVGRTLDRAKRAGVAIVSSLGRHRNDGMLSFYMRGPGGFDIEVGCGGLLLDGSWRANEFCEGDVWGHDGLIEAVKNAAKEISDQE
jgi:3,4-dihydroxy-9,10-secoandrosta-1,3,5(10)-triene-9,17-dione 4,5-dioxygenase